MSHLIRRSKQLFIVGLFGLALVSTLFFTPPAATIHADNPTPTPTATPAGGWSDPVGG